VRKTKAKFDYVNMSQGVLDAMQVAGYIPDDDCYHVVPDFMRRHRVDKGNAGVEITVRQWRMHE
jgi:hypothetical protein